jgi:hypothetical protein
MSEQKDDTGKVIDLQALTGVKKVGPESSTKDKAMALLQGCVEELANDRDPFEVIAEVRKAMEGLQRGATGAFTGTYSQIPASALDPRHRPPPRRYLLVREPELQPDDEPQRADAREWVGVLPAGKVGMLAAAGGAGKTFAVVQLAVAVATGGRLFGSWQAQGAGRVLLALGEEDQDEVFRRLWYVVEDLELSPEERRAILDRVRVMPLAGHPIGLTDDSGGRTPALRELLDLLEKEAGEEGWSLIVLDPLARLAGPGAEADNALGTALVTALETLTQVKGGPTVIVAHHTSQAARQQGRLDATASRGVTALTDGIRWQATMAPTGEDRDILTLRVGKTNYGPHPPDLFLTRSRHGVLVPLPAERVAAVPGNEKRTENVRAWLYEYIKGHPECSTAMQEAAARLENGGPGVGKSALSAARDELQMDGQIVGVKAPRGRVNWSVVDADSSSPDEEAS